LQSAPRRYGRPQILDTDQGAQFTGKALTGVLQAAEVRISMDGKGRALDNIMVERLWRSVKYEEIYLKDYPSVAELVRALQAYFGFYNHERPHQAHRGLTPAQAAHELTHDGLLDFQQQDFYILFQWGAVLTEGSTSGVRCRLLDPFCCGTVSPQQTGTLPQPWIYW
jgi:hypothetical protein